VTQLRRSEQNVQRINKKPKLTYPGRVGATDKNVLLEEGEAKRINTCFRKRISGLPWSPAKKSTGKKFEFANHKQGK